MEMTGIPPTLSPVLSPKLLRLESFVPIIEATRNCRLRGGEDDNLSLDDYFTEVSAPEVSAVEKLGLRMEQMFTSLSEALQKQTDTLHRLIFLIETNENTGRVERQLTRQTILLRSLIKGKGTGKSSAAVNKRRRHVAGEWNEIMVEKEAVLHEDTYQFCLDMGDAEPCTSSSLHCP